MKSNILSGVNNDFKVGTGSKVQRSSSIVSAAPADPESWSMLLKSDPASIPSQGPQWRAALASGGWSDSSILYTTGDGRRFVLPLWTRGFGAISIAASPPPAWGFGGLVGPDLDQGVTHSVLQDLRSRGYGRVSIRPRVDQSILWEQSTSNDDIVISRHCHLLDLRDGSTVIRSRMSKNARRELSRIEGSTRVDIVHDVGGTFLPIYYNLYLRSLERWAERSGEPLSLAKARGRLRDPLSKLQAMAAALGPDFHLWLGYVDGVPAGGMIVLYGNNAHDTRGAMDHVASQNLSINLLLQWNAIQHACQSGLSWYHLGETAPKSSLAAFKEKVGAIGIDCAEIRIERGPFTAAETRVKTAIKTVVKFRDH